MSVRARLFAALLLVALALLVSRQMGAQPAPPSGLGIGVTPKFQLTVSKSGTGSGTVSGTGITCGSDCGQSFNSGASVTLTATPSGTDTFAGWSGSCSGTGTCVLSMTAARAVTATFTAAGGGGGNLATAAANLAVKGWTQVTFQVSGFPTLGDLIWRNSAGANDGSILEFANSAAWDPVHRQMRFVGQAHGNTYQGRHIQFDAATNTFSELAWPPECQGIVIGQPGCPNHAYDHNGGVNPSGDTFYKRYGNPTIRRYRPGSGWAALTPNPGPLAFDGGTGSCCSVLRYLNPMAAVMYVDPSSGIWKGTGPGADGSGTATTWTCIAKSGDPAGNCPGSVLSGLTGATQMTGEYSPLKGVLCFGQGASLYCMNDVTGAITQRANTPLSMSLQGGQFTVDPVSGNFLNYRSGGPMYEYNPTTDVWSAVNTTVPGNIADGVEDANIVFPISTYGVTGHIVSLGPTDARFFIYKHTASGGGGGDVTPPTAPTNPAASPVSSSQITLTWTAATDAVGVTQNLVERCTGAGCSNFVQLPAMPLGAVTSFSDTGLLASTSYSYRIRAGDAANNLGVYSSTVSAITSASGGGSSADADFDLRCGGAPKDGSGPGANGVLRCFGFDNASVFLDPEPCNSLTDCSNRPAHAWGLDYGLMANGPSPLIPTIDTTTFTSGSGAMKQHTHGGPDIVPGYFFTHFGVGKTHQLAQGGISGASEVYYQYRYRITPSALDASLWPQGNGFKSDIMSFADLPTCAASGGQISSLCTTTCQQSTFVTQNSNFSGYVGAYMNCGGLQPFTEPHNVPGDGSINRQAAWTGGCNDHVNGGAIAEPNCFMYRANEWMTIKKYMKMGTWNNFDTVIKVWAGHEGQPLQLIHHCGPGSPRVCNYGHDGQTGIPANPQGWLADGGTICDGNGTNCHTQDEYHFGKVYLLSYVTCNDSNGCTWASNAAADVWYDELIISTQDIPDPGAGTQSGLDWDGTGSARRMLYWNNPFPIYPATYIFKVFPRKKNAPTDSPTGYYTTFFWGNNGRFDWIGPGLGDMFYGAHPYPAGGAGAPNGFGEWEISVHGSDPTTGVEVSWNRWHQQAVRVRKNGTTFEHEFYYDWPDQSKVLISNFIDPAWATQTPPVPAIVMGQAPDFCGAPPCVSAQHLSWGGYPGWEEFNGIIRGIQIYNNYLSLTDIAAEIAVPQSSTAGNASIWYLNPNPRPTDVTDKKVGGTPHHGTWACPGIVTTCPDVTEWTGP